MFVWAWAAVAGADGGSSSSENLALIIMATAVLSLLLAWAIPTLLGRPAPAKAELPDSTSSGAGAGTPGDTASSAGKPAEALRTFAAEEVAKHNRDGDCWIIVKGKVYDVTDYVIMHPGGDAILNNAGGDSTEGFFAAQHPQAAMDTMEEYLIGTLAAS